MPGPGPSGGTCKGPTSPAAPPTVTSSAARWFTKPRVHLVTVTQRPNAGQLRASDPKSRAADRGGCEPPCCQAGPHPAAAVASGRRSPAAPRPLPRLPQRRPTSPVRRISSFHTAPCASRATVEGHLGCPRAQTSRGLCEDQREGARRGAVRGSPAQVAVHGLHAVVLAARQGAQLVEWHSWGERCRSAWSRHAHPKPGIEGLVGRRAGSAGDTAAPGDPWQTVSDQPAPPGLPLRGPGLQWRQVLPG